MSKLEWVKECICIGGNEYPIAESVVGRYAIVPLRSGDGFRLLRNGNFIHDGDGKARFDSERAAKAAAEQHYLARLMEALSDFRCLPCGRRAPREPGRGRRFRRFRREEVG